MTLLNVISSGLWPIAVLFLAGAVAAFRAAFKASKSNSTQQVNGVTVDNTGDIPVWKLWHFWVGVLCAVCFMAFVIFS